MLHLKFTDPLVRESHARAALQQFAVYGASIHRLGSSGKFCLLIPLRKPERRQSLLRQLDRQTFGQRKFELVWLLGFDAAGPQFVTVHESQLDEDGSLIEPLDGTELTDNWLDEATA